MFERLQQRKTEFNEAHIQKLIPEIQKDEVFVEYAKDNEPNKIHIVIFTYAILAYGYTVDENHVYIPTTSAIKDSKSCFDLYFDVLSQKYSFKSNFIITQPESAKKLYQIANEKLHNPSYFYTKVNYLRKKLSEKYADFTKNMKNVSKMPIAGKPYIAR